MYRKNNCANFSLTEIYLVVIHISLLGFLCEWCMEKIKMYYNIHGTYMSGSSENKKEPSRDADLNHRPKDNSCIYSTVLRSTNWAITG